MSEIPEYCVYKSKRKSIRLTLKKNGKFAVYCPLSCSKKEIRDFVAANYRKLLEKRIRQAVSLFDGSAENISLPLGGKYFPAVVTENGRNKITFDGNTFSVPDLRDKALLSAIYREFLRTETRKIIPGIIADFADKYGFEVNQIRIKASTSRWGSCSYNHNLNFSLALAACDISFVKYVVAHELCHTVHLNHGKEFYLLLDSVLPDHRKIRDKYIKEYGKLLNAVFYTAL